MKASQQKRSRGSIAARLAVVIAMPIALLATVSGAATAPPLNPIPFTPPRGLPGTAPPLHRDNRHDLHGVGQDPTANGRFRLHDASLYHGKYYLYFGPTPALVLFLPYKVLTGSHLPSSVAVALFCTGGFACSCALFFLLAKLEKWDIPAWLASAGLSLKHRGW